MNIKHRTIIAFRPITFLSAGKVVTLTRGGFAVPTVGPCLSLESVNLARASAHLLGYLFPVWSVRFELSAEAADFARAAALWVGTAHCQMLWTDTCFLI